MEKHRIVILKMYFNNVAYHLGNLKIQKNSKVRKKSGNVWIVMDCHGCLVFVLSNFTHASHGDSHFSHRKVIENENKIILYLLYLEHHEDLRVKELNSSSLQDFIDLVYDNTSKHLLDVLFKKYKFMEHLKVHFCFVLITQCPLNYVV